MAARGFLGGGDLYIARFVGGVAGPLVGPYECTKFEIKPNIEVKEQVSRGRSTRGQVIESVPLAQPSDLTVELPEVNTESLAIALLGTASVIAQGAGTVAAPGENLTAKLGGWVRLTKENVSALVVKNSADTVTYVLGTDYEFNSRLGMVRAIGGGAIAADAVLHIAYTYSAVAGMNIAGSTNTQVRALFLLDGKNFADDSPCQVQVWEASIAADSAFDFMGNEFANVSLPGRMKTPTGKTEPYNVRLLTTLI